MSADVCVRRVAVLPDGSGQLVTFDYSDAFEAHTDLADERPAAEWLRAGLEDAPLLVRRLVLVTHRHALRLRLEPRQGGDTLLGWRITKRDPDDARLEAWGPLITGRIVARRQDPHTVRLDTFVTFNSRRAAAVTWSIVGPLHRAVTPYLMKRAALSGRVPTT